MFKNPQLTNKEGEDPTREPCPVQSLPAALPGQECNARQHSRRPRWPRLALVIALSTPLAAQAAAIGPLGPVERALKAYELRSSAALDNLRQPLPTHPANGDELRYPNKINSYTKGLPHDDLGIVAAAYQALTRDVPFIDYGSSPLIGEAVADLSALSDFRGPREGGQVTANTLFRGIGAGETVGPYISQCLLQPIPAGASKIDQKYKVPVAGNDHMTEYSQWLNIQRGGAASTSVTYETSSRVFFGRMHNHKTGQASHPLHAELLASAALPKV